jgi:hypothetical protein
MAIGVVGVDKSRRNLVLVLCGGGLSGAEVVNDLACVERGIDLGVDADDLAFLNDISDTAIESETHDAILDAIGIGDFLVGIDQQWEGQIILLDEATMRISGIDAASEEHNASFL